MSKEIVIDKSIIEENGPGDLILKIDGYDYKEKKEEIYPSETSFLMMDLEKIRNCENGYDQFQVPNGDAVCVCKTDDGRIQIGFERRRPK